MQKIIPISASVGVITKFWIDNYVELRWTTTLAKRIWATCSAFLYLGNIM